jgi:hypothetical protein
MKISQEILSNIKQVLVYAYVWQIPFSWRIILVPNRSHSSTGFNEYMDISLYIGEILLIFALIIHITEYKMYKKSILSNFQLKPDPFLKFPVEHLVIIALMGFCLLINIFYSIDFFLSISSLFHILGILLFVFLLNDQYVSRGTIVIRELFKIFTASLVIQLIIGLSQIFAGSSIGLKLLNESTLSITMNNVAKSHFFDYIILRAYGTFPHPNILASFGLLVLVYIFIYKDFLFHVEQKITMCAIISAILVVLVSQSKLAFIFLLFCLFIFGTRYFKLFHVKHWKKLATGLIFLLPVIVVFNQDIKTSFITRFHQFELQKNFIKPSLFGYGLGTYRLTYDVSVEDWWNKEPIHFVPIIALSELGIVLAFLIVVSISRYILNVPRETLPKLTIPILFVLFIISVDHYAWDIYQGQIFLVFTAWLILSIDK